VGRADVSGVASGDASAPDMRCSRTDAPEHVDAANKSDFAGWGYDPRVLV
jgi:hypothetical protein